MNHKNVGISLLRIVMSFAVVVIHFGGAGGELISFIKSRIGGLAVPCFMFISFYLLSEKFEQMTGEFIKNRIKRLYYPVIVWSAAYYILYLISGQMGIADWRNLFYSIIFATSLNPPLWFNITQILIIIFLVCLYYVIQKSDDRTVCLIITIVAMIFIQYTGINEYLFGSAVFESKYTLGRFAETLPMAIAGLLYGKYEKSLSAKTKGFVYIGVIFCTIIFVFVGNAGATGYDYQGLYTFWGTIFVCLTAIVVPLPLTNRITGVVNYVADYTMGIYCMHFAAGQYIVVIANKIGISCGYGTLIYDLLIWTICLLVSMLIGFLSSRIKGLQNLVQ